MLFASFALKKKAINYRDIHFLERLMLRSIQACNMDAIDADVL